MDQREGLAQNAATVFGDLERIGQETQQEVERLNRELQERLDTTDQSVASITHLLALEQEADRLRLILQEKERALEAITSECRRLEDQLEDQRLAYDGLKQEFERKLEALNTARGRTDQLEAELNRLRTGDRGGWVAPPVSVASDALDGGVSARPGQGSRLLVWAGLTIVLVAGAGAVLLWWLSDLPFGAASMRPPPRPAAAPHPDPVPSMDPEPRDSPPPSNPNATLGSTPDSALDRDPPMVLGTLQDRLPDGASGPLMVALRGGRFTMGHAATDLQDTAPEREVLIGGYLIGAHEVTFDDFDRFVRATGRRAPADFGWGRGVRPVVDVSWHDALAYAQWLGRETGQTYRLPSEAEWEFAARGGVDSSYWWGNTPERNRAVCFDCGSQWDNRSTAPVASFPANPFGLYDTAGNAAEWVADCYRPNYQGAPSDGRAWNSRSCEFRVVRGGSFSRPASSMRRFARSRQPPTTLLNMIGFRVAREP